MYYANVICGTVIGINGIIVNIEINIDKRAFPTFNIVGLASKEVTESKERVISAIKNSGFEFPNYKITVSLSPADIPKKGSHYDLAIAVGILYASNQLKIKLSKFVLIGELSLDGRINLAESIYPVAVVANDKDLTLIVSRNNYEDIKYINSCKYILVDKLSDLKQQKHYKKISISKNANKKKYLLDLSDFNEISGQVNAKRALIIAVSGFHNIALRGAPGIGKTALVRSIKNMLPPLNANESTEIRRIYSVSKMYRKAAGIDRYNRPFRSPHHTITLSGLIGGGINADIGEITLAHKGILFLDEFTQFPNKVINSLRTPIEDKKIFIVRNGRSYEYPCDFILVISYNPCPCGYLGHPKIDCKCTAKAIQKYQNILSGPIMDRIDLNVDCNLNIISSEKSESLKNIANSLIISNEMQTSRYRKSNFKFNGHLNYKNIKNYISFDSSTYELIDKISKKYNPSYRQLHKLIKVSRTIADLDGSDNVREEHILESFQYSSINNRLKNL